MIATWWRVRGFLSFDSETLPTFGNDISPFDLPTGCLVILEHVSPCQCSQKLNLVSETHWLFFSDIAPLSFIRSCRISAALSQEIGSSTKEIMWSNISCGRSVKGACLWTSIAHQSRCWGGTFAVEMTRMWGSTRNIARILRWPGLVSSLSLKGWTQCWRTFGKAIILPSRVDTEPRTWEMPTSWRP